MNQPSKNLILYEGNFYDVTEFKKKHPGGKTIIENNLWTPDDPTDATVSIKMMHPNTTKVEAMMKAYEVKEENTHIIEKKEEVQLMSDFMDLKRELENEGFFKASYFHIAMRFLVLIGLYLLGFYLLSKSVILGVIVISIGFAQSGWLQHECGHNSLTCNKRVDKFLQRILFVYFLTGSSSFWNYQHNLHHVSTQHIEKDIDLKTMPLLSFNREISGDNPGFFVRIQKYTWFWLNNTLVYPIWIFVVHPRYEIRKKNYLYVFHILLTYIVNTSIVKYVTGYSYTISILIVILYFVIGLDILLFNFAPSHTTTDVYHKGKNWIEMASEHTINIHSHPVTNWWMGYLNFQIEHHLFPQMPQFRHPLIADRVKKFFEDHGFEYKCVGYFEAIKDVFENMGNVSHGKQKNKID